MKIGTVVRDVIFVFLSLFVVCLFVCFYFHGENIFLSMKYEGYQTERSSIYSAVSVHQSSGLTKGQKLYPTWLMPASYIYFVVLLQLSMCVLPNACYHLIDTYLGIQRK